MDKYKQFGKTIRLLRENRGLSSADFSVQVDINYTSLSSIENGRLFPTASVAVNMVNFFGVGFDECVYGKKNDVTTVAVIGLLNKINKEKYLKFAYQFLLELKKGLLTL